MADACPNCGVWLGNEPLPNDSAWERLRAEIERLRAEVERLRAENATLRRNEWRLIWGLCTKCGKDRDQEARRG